MTQEEIDFTPPSARGSDPETSHMAAADAVVGASRGRVLALQMLDTLGPLTDFELAARTGMQQTSIGKRRGECASAGLIEALTINGVKQRRTTPSGSLAQVWAITDPGRNYLRST